MSPELTSWGLSEAVASVSSVVLARKMFDDATFEISQIDSVTKVGDRPGFMSKARPHIARAMLGAAIISLEEVLVEGCYSHNDFVARVNLAVSNSPISYKESGNDIEVLSLLKRQAMMEAFREDPSFATLFEDGNLLPSAMRQLIFSQGMLLEVKKQAGIFREETSGKILRTPDSLGWLEERAEKLEDLLEDSGEGKITVKLETLYLSGRDDIRSAAILRGMVEKAVVVGLKTSSDNGNTGFDVVLPVSAIKGDSDGGFFINCAEVAEFYDLRGEEQLALDFGGDETKQG